MIVDTDGAVPVSAADGPATTGELGRVHRVVPESVPQLKPTVYRPRGAQQPLAMLCC